MFEDPSVRRPLPIPMLLRLERCATPTMQAGSSNNAKAQFSRYHGIDHSCVALQVLSAEQYLHHLSPAADAPGIAVQKLQPISWLCTFADKHADKLLDCQLVPDAGALIIYTSGTTGHPKGVLHTHRYLHGLRKQSQLGLHLLCLQESLLNTSFL